MTEDQERAFERLGFYAVTDAQHRQDAIAEKKRVVEEVWRRKLLSTEILRHYRMVYVCSHIDITLALLLGGRHIDLVDPHLASPQTVCAVIDLVESIIQEQVEATLRGIRFRFDFGQGDEMVDVRLLAQAYRPDRAGEENPATAWKIEMMESVQRDSGDRFAPLDGRPSYEPDGPIGVLLGFAMFGPSLDQNRQTLNAIVPGGYLIAIAGPFEDLPLAAEEAFSYVQGTTKEGWEEISFRLYQMHGRYDFISLGNTVGPETYYSFLKKR